MTDAPVASHHDVFISYSSHDKATADAVCAVMEQHDIRCWMAPRDVVPGMVWDDQVLAAIEGARVLVLVLTHYSNSSPEVEKEVMAAAKAGLVILPLRAEEVEPSRMLTFHLGRVHWLDAFTPPLEEHARHLTETVKRFISGTRLSSGEEDAPRPDDGSRSTIAPPDRTTRGADDAAFSRSRGDAYAQIAQYELAIAEYSEAIRLRPDYPEAVHNRGNAYLARNELDLAIADFDRAIILRPDYASAYGNRGSAYLKKQLLDRALQDFEEAIRLNPRSHLALNNRGSVYFSRGDFDRAIADYDAAIRLKPDYSQAISNRALAQQRRAGVKPQPTPPPRPQPPSPDPGKERRGLKGWQIGLIIAGCVFGLIVIAGIIGAAGKSKSGDTTTDTTVAMTPSVPPETPPTAVPATPTMVGCSDSDATIAGCTAFIDANAGTPLEMSTAFNRRGNLYFDQKNDERAIQDYTSSLALDQDGNVYTNRANTYSRRNNLGDYDLAMADYDKAIELNSRYGKAYYNRGVMKYNHGDQEGGNADMQTGRSLDPSLASQ